MMGIGLSCLICSIMNLQVMVCVCGWASYLHCVCALQLTTVSLLVEAFVYDSRTSALGKLFFVGVLDHLAEKLQLLISLENGCVLVFGLLCSLFIVHSSSFCILLPLSSLCIL